MEWMCFKIAERQHGRLPPGLTMALRNGSAESTSDVRAKRLERVADAIDVSLVRGAAQAGRQFTIYADLELCLPCDGRKGMHVHLRWYPGGQVRFGGQAFPNVRDLLSVKDKQAVTDFESDCAVVLYLRKGTPTMAFCC